jgi:hypothetical protein
MSDFSMRVPEPLMRRLVGDDVVDYARAHDLDLTEDFHARLLELLATSERVRLAEEVAARAAERTDAFLEEEQRLFDLWRTGA